MVITFARDLEPEVTLTTLEMDFITSFFITA